MVCGWQFLEMKNTLLLDFDERRAKVIASAAAVPSSSNEELATSKPVKSVNMVWKFNKASKRPCEISGWYGV